MYVLGAVTSSDQTLFDGTTPAEREMIAAKISQLTADFSAKLTKMLNGDMSWWSVAFSGPITFAAKDARQMLIRAQTELNTLFLPAALNAVRDYDRSLAEVQETVLNYLNGVARLMGAAISTKEHGNWVTMFKDAKKTGSEWLSAAKDEVTDVLPWWVYPVVGLAALTMLGYSVRSFK